MWGVAGVVLAATLALAGCSDLPYYWQTVSGHLQIMEAARPIDEWLQEPQTPERLRERLELARRIRAFASRVLHEPSNPSYTRYFVEDPTGNKMLIFAGLSELVGAFLMRSIVRIKY